METNNQKSSSFILDGRSRALRGGQLKERICAEVMSQYADELARAGFVRRIILRYKISREIKKELEKIAPSDALYCSTASKDL